MKCKCDTDMEFVGNNADGRYWCPKCGRYSQSYVCHKTLWKEPLSSDAVLGEVWRDASKIKPKADERVILWIKYNSNFSNYEMESFGEWNGKVWYCDYDTGHFDVLYWMPKPNPPAFA